MISENSRIRRHEEVVYEKGADELILLKLADGQYFTLDEVGRTVWSLCDGTRSVADIVGLVHEEYEAPRATIRADVLELLEELAKEQLIVVEGT
jgi:Coenzyme PQQ synthesis protein D (PqqD)